MTSSKPAACSISAIGAALLLLGFAFWLRTPAAHAFNEQFFGRFYTAGAILMLGCYGLVFFLLAGMGIVASVGAWVRKETPAWLRWAATGMTMVAPVAAVSIIKGH